MNLLVKRGGLFFGLIVAIFVGMYFFGFFRDAAVVSASNHSTYPGLAPSTNISYTEYAGNVLNPERGMYHRTNEISEQDTYNKIYTTRQSTLAHIYIDLKTERDNPTISQQRINELKQTLDKVKAAGIKAIIRFQYMDGRGNVTKDQPTGIYYPNQSPPSEYDPNPDVIKRHIQDVAIVLNDPMYKPYIAFIEAGFVGAWGEWHNSFDKNSGTSVDTVIDLFGKSFRATAPQKEKRKSIRDQLFASFPGDRFIIFRYPMDVKDDWYPNTLPATQLIDQSNPQSRVGHHNDCFLSDFADSGTYKYNNNTADRETYIAYLERMSKYAPIGGETCSYSNPSIYRCDGSDPIRGPIKDMSRMGWTYLNNDFEKKVTGGIYSSTIEPGSWKDPATGACRNEIEAKLGYRFVLNQAELPSAIKPGGRFLFKATIQNKGWASMYNQRPVILVLFSENGSQRYELPYPTSEADPRLWEANTSKTLESLIEIPNIPEGTYKIGLWLPDSSTLLKANPRHAVRFANNGMWSPDISTWSSSNGINVLGTIAVTQSAPGESNPSASGMRFLDPSNTPPAPSPTPLPTPTSSPSPSPTPPPTSMVCGRPASSTPAPNNSCNIKINFQTATAPTPTPNSTLSEYKQDIGEAYGARDRGGWIYDYGWTNLSDVATTNPESRIRNGSAGLLLNTLNHMQYGSNLSNHRNWKISLPNGSYSVKIVVGDPSYYDGEYRILAEAGTANEVEMIAAVPNSGTRHFEATKTVTVTDGNLNITSGALTSTNAPNNKLNYIEISPAGTPAPPSACNQADIDQSGTVDQEDKNILIANLLQPQLTNPRADITGDGTVNMLDYSFLNTHMGSSCQ